MCIFSRRILPEDGCSLFRRNVGSRRLSRLPSLCSVVAVRGELSYLAPLGNETISAPYFKQCFFQRGYYPPDSQTPRLPVPRQK